MTTASVEAESQQASVHLSTHCPSLARSHVCAETACFVGISQESLPPGFNLWFIGNLQKKEQSGATGIRVLVGEWLVGATNNS